MQLKTVQKSSFVDNEKTSEKVSKNLSLLIYSPLRGTITLVLFLGYNLEADIKLSICAKAHVIILLRANISNMVIMFTSPVPQLVTAEGCTSLSLLLPEVSSC